MTDRPLDQGLNSTANRAREQAEIDDIEVIKRIFGNFSLFGDLPIF